MDVDGFIFEDVFKWLPYWALELARIYLSRGRLHFSFQLNSWTCVDIFWPNEENENWYL